jgi:hypothetical protein
MALAAASAPTSGAMATFPTAPLPPAGVLAPEALLARLPPVATPVMAVVLFTSKNNNFFEFSINIEYNL